MGFFIFAKLGCSHKCVRAELHLDESTPHIHAYVVPINDKTKLLSYKEMFGGNPKVGAIKLSKLQDSYAQALAHLGIERGVKGSKATHTKVKEYYAAVNSNPLMLELDRLAPQQEETAQQLFERIKTDPQIQAINHQLADRKRSLEHEKRASQKASQSEKLRSCLEQRVQELEAENFKWLKQASKLRDLPLEDVAWKLGFDRADTGENRWKGQGRVINITDAKWYDFTEEKGGGGAIDLVMHVNECNFRSSVAWLYDRFGEEEMLKAARAYAEKQTLKIAQTESVPQFVPPPEDKNQWQVVRNYFTQERGLPDNLVQTLHSSGVIYADKNQNAIFIMRSSEGLPSGAFLRGTRGGKDNEFMGYAFNTKRNASWFYFIQGGNDQVQRVAIAKSPIDALSLAVLDKPTETTLYLVADSARNLPLEFLKDKDVIVAYDGDSAGDEKAREIKQLLPQATRIRPIAEDWNEQLLKRLRQKEQESKQQRELECD
jgi:septum formation inhibitor MinC